MRMWYAWPETVQMRMAKSIHMRLKGARMSHVQATHECASIMHNEHVK